MSHHHGENGGDAHGRAGRDRRTRSNPRARGDGITNKEVPVLAAPNSVALGRAVVIPRVGTQRRPRPYPVRVVHSFVAPHRVEDPASRRRNATTAMRDLERPRVARDVGIRRWQRDRVPRMPVHRFASPLATMSVTPPNVETPRRVPRASPATSQHWADLPDCQRCIQHQATK